VVAVHRQDIEARRVAGRHHVRHLSEIDLERVDANEGQADLGRAPFGQHIQRQQPVRRQAGDQLALRHRRQRMHDARRILQYPLGLGEIGFDFLLGDDPVGQQPRENRLQVELAQAGGFLRDGVHGGPG